MDEQDYRLKVIYDQTEKQPTQESGIEQTKGPEVMMFGLGWKEEDFEPGLEGGEALSCLGEEGEDYSRRHWFERARLLFLSLFLAALLG